VTRFARTPLIALVAAGALALGACSTSESGTDAAAGSESVATEGASASNDASEDTVTITDNYGEKTVPTPPKRVVALDNRSFELLDSWGIKPVAAPRDIVPNSIPGIADDEDIVNIGNHREPNLEAIVAADPDVIISGQRFETFDEELQKLVPDATLLDFEPRDGEPIDREIIRQTLELGDVFGKQAEAEQAVQEFTEAVQRARNAYDPEQKVMALNVSGGEIGYVAPGVGRVWGPLFDLIGFTPALEVENASDDHQGDDISVEAIANANPDWLLGTGPRRGREVHHGLPGSALRDQRLRAAEERHRSQGRPRLRRPGGHLHQRVHLHLHRDPQPDLRAARGRQVVCLR